ncbi:MAG TPA: glutamate--tRNA ligase, partial [Xanthobacteraceae bacterium]|nr:glutamate--tRNA ligase [Xanthobacteraceae bacterium]
MPGPIVRFAPSPTGLIHIGNARTALLNALFARKHGGSFILRLDDTDRARSEERFAEAIKRDLAWLGIPPDRIETQSSRITRYEAALTKLHEMGRAYPCYETEEELDRKRKRQLGRGLPPAYDRAALALRDEDRAKLEAEGRKAYWRFKLDHRVVKWNDLVRGEIAIDTASLSDPVVCRADGTWLYSLASVVDDIDMNVTHIIRGEDHITNTAAQLDMFVALGGKEPILAHHNLLTLPGGEGLSKRFGSLSLQSLREAGHEALAIAAAAVLTGTSLAVEPVENLDALAEKIDFKKISHGPARFDPADLDGLTARTLHGASYAAMAGRLEELGVSGGEKFWLAVRGNLSRFHDAKEWWDVVSAPLAPKSIESDREFLKLAETLLPAEPWGEKVWDEWLAAIKQASSRKGRELFHPLRIALTGRENGPELRALLPL